MNGRETAEAVLAPADKTEPTLRDRLREFLPKEAIKAHPSKAYLSSINPMYVIERLNDVFGENGWEATYRIVETGPMVVAECILQCFPPDQSKPITRQTFGGNDNKDLGDAFKGACTDALTKAASQIGIGAEVYKGIYDGKTPLVDKKAEKSFKKEFSKQTEEQARKITPAEKKVFWAAVKKGGKTNDQVSAYFKSLKISKTEDMLYSDFDMCLKWATGMEPDLTQTLKKSIESVDAPLSDKHNFAKLFALAAKHNIPKEDVRQVGHEIYQVNSLNDLTPDQFEALLEWVEQQVSV
jgi:hypothetical protein